MESDHGHTVHWSAACRVSEVLYSCSFEIDMEEPTQRLIPIYYTLGLIVMGIIFIGKSKTVWNTASLLKKKKVRLDKNHGQSDDYKCFFLIQVEGEGQPTVLALVLIVHKEFS